VIVDARAPSLEEDDQPRSRWERAVGWVIVGLCTWAVFNILAAGHDWSLQHFRWGALFQNTTTNGGDMGAHVWWPWFLEHHWFPKLRLSGWAPDWYAGFPAGHYYFPLPAVMIGLLDSIPGMPYNVAFKLVTISGPMMLPASAYVFARGMRAPWPAPPAFAVAAFGLLVETRTDWQIYGGNIASTLAGEFSFTMGLAFALFGLGALAHTLDTGRRRWLPALLIALAIMSHVVVTIFIGLAAVLLWVTRRPWRTWPIATAVGAVGVSLSAVWLFPLLGQRKYTQSMRYTKLIPSTQGFAMWSWLPVPGFVRHLVDNFVRALGHTVDPNTGKHATVQLWLPWWIWALAGVAIVAAGWYRRRSTAVLLVLAFVMGILFVQWPDGQAIWNTRFLPFWLLTWGLLAAMGAAELLRAVATAVGWAYRWIRDGDLQDARARAWAELATSEDPDVDPDVRKDAAWALAERRFDANPTDWEPPERLRPEAVRAIARRITTYVLAGVVAVAGLFALHRGWDARDNNPGIAIQGWANWNYTGYEAKSTWPQYWAVMSGMDEVAHTYGNGRALWEPSSGEPDALNSYGTSLSLELLPYFTNGRIGSMEGLYFESSATTAFHFLTVSECSPHPSNPVRGEEYASFGNDFDMCVRHLQMLGVRYLMLWSGQAQKLADKSAQLTLVRDIPQNPPISAPSPDKELKDWKVYQVANSDLVVGMSEEPVVVTQLRGGSQSKCWGTNPPGPGSQEPHLPGWECTTAPWWRSRTLLKTAYAESGPKEWTRVDAKALASVVPKAVTPVEVTNVDRSVDKISFHVSEIGKPVEVKESFFPNWHVRGAKGPYRLAPNLMVVIPTSNDVTLNYGMTPIDWLGRVVTLLGVAGVVLLVRWKGALGFAAEASSEPAGDDDDRGASGGGEPADGDEAEPADGDEPEPPGEPEPPEEKETEPALP
jgi:hypothetical protein